MIDLLEGSIEDELKKPIIATPISTAIRLVEWKPEDGVMRVTFTSGRVYDYPEISREQVQNLINAPSVGRYLNEHFRMR